MAIAYFSLLKKKRSVGIAHTLAEIGKTCTTTIIGGDISVVDSIIRAMLEIANFKERANYGRITRTQRISGFWQPRSGSIFN
ncbi:hypothetical protein [Trichormus sp. NMC-1]|uniref:hypothetical protein n=1 Tax=Trichormus sp. NMC-1 TaxID=1853259 RepID=UPI0015A6979A|nr:hypothetical protein [Trichormus sp. NMC-1]